MDFYAVLGLGRNAELDAIANAYRRSALATNPESNKEHPDLEALEKRFTQVAQAYIVLSNPRIRAIYDQYGEDGVRHSGQAIAPGDKEKKAFFQGGVDIDSIDPYNVFRQFFGVENPFQIIGDINGVQNNQHMFFSASFGTNKILPKCDPVKVTLKISLEDIFEGNVKNVTWTSCRTNQRDEILDSKQNSYDVRLPKGAKEGDSLTIFAQGNEKEGFCKGDVLVTFTVAKHPRYGRNGDDLILTHPITLVEALCGTEFVFHTFEGRELPVCIDQIVDARFRKVITGQGLPIKDKENKRGDLIIACPTQFPSYLSTEQKVEIKRILEAKENV